MKLLEHFKELSIYPQNAKELKGLILQLAIQGKLTAQWRAENSSLSEVEGATIDNNAKTLLEQIQAEKAQLIKDKKIKKEKALPPISKEEIPFELPENWEWTRLGEIGDWGAGATPLRSNGDFYGGEINWFKSGELNNGFMDYESVEKITDLAIQKTSVRLNQPGDVLIAMYGATIGKTGFLKVEGATNQAVCACTCYNGMYNEYLHLLLKALKKEFLDQGEGGAQPNISRVKIRNKIFAIPPLAEQKAIVQIVDTLFKEVEALEELTQKRVQLKEDFITSALRRLSEGEVEKEWAFLQQHFSTFMTEESNVKKLRECILQLAIQGKLTSDWRSKNTSVVAVDIERLEILRKKYQEESSKQKGQKRFSYKKSVKIDIGGKSKGADSLFDLPSNWKWTSLGQLSWSINDGPHFSPNYVDTGIPILSGRNISFDRGIDFSTAKYITASDHEEFTKRGTPSIGDILLTKGGTTGVPCVIETGEVFSIWVHLALIKVIREYVDPYYLRLALASPYVYKQSQAQTHGIGNKDLGLTRMIYFAIPLPPKEEQQAIVTKVNELMALCDTLEQEIAKNKEAATKLMQSVLREVFQGKPDSVARPVSVEV